MRRVNKKSEWVHFLSNLLRQIHNPLVSVATCFFILLHAPIFMYWKSSREQDESNPKSAEHRVTPTTFNQPVCGLALHTGPTTSLPHSAPSQPDRGKWNTQLTCIYPTNRKLCCMVHMHTAMCMKNFIHCVYGRDVKDLTVLWCFLFFSFFYGRLIQGWCCKMRISMNSGKLGAHGFKGVLQYPAVSFLQA